MGTINPALFSSMEWRSIGPHRGGRVVAVAGDPVDPMAFYFGACAGGSLEEHRRRYLLEKRFRRLLQNFSRGRRCGFRLGPQRCLRAGMGEACLRGNVCHGDGVYRSTDGGGSWTHLGLEDTRHIARVRMHPGDPDLWFTSRPWGHAFGSNDDRGVFRSKNGGKSWDKVLFKSPKGRRDGPVHGPQQPKNPIRCHLSSAAISLDLCQWRPGQRTAQVHGRWRHLDRHNRQSGVCPEDSRAG